MVEPARDSRRRSKNVTRSPARVSDCNIVKRYFRSLLGNITYIQNRWCSLSISSIGTGWYFADVNQNCDDACAAINMECSEQALYDHNADVDSSAELLSLIQSLGGTISAGSCGGAYGTGQDVPNYSASDNFCLYSDSSRQLSTFNCAISPTPTSQNKRRLCWCTDGKCLNLFLLSIRCVWRFGFLLRHYI